MNARILSLYRQGVGPEAIARAEGLPVAEVITILRQRGVTESLKRGIDSSDKVDHDSIDRSKGESVDILYLLSRLHPQPRALCLRLWRERYKAHVL